MVLDGKGHGWYFTVNTVVWTSVLMLEKQAQLSRSKESYLSHLLSLLSGGPCSEITIHGSP